MGKKGRRRQPFPASRLTGSEEPWAEEVEGRKIYLLVVQIGL